MGAVKKAISSVTDLVGLTDNSALEAQQRAMREQQKALENQATLEANSATDSITNIDSGGAAAASADAITSAQKKRRAAGQSNVLGL